MGPFRVQKWSNDRKIDVQDWLQFLQGKKSFLTNDSKVKLIDYGLCGEAFRVNLLCLVE